MKPVKMKILIVLIFNMEFIARLLLCVNQGTLWMIIGGYFCFDAVHYARKYWPKK